MDGVDRILAQWNSERLDLDVSSMGLIGRINRLARHLTREMEKTFAAYDLNFASFDVLATLRRSGPPHRLSPGALMDAMMITSGTMTNRIDQLAKRGLVERVAQPEDRRSVLIALTDEGFSLIDRAVESHVATQKRLTAGLSPSDRQALDALLKTYLATFE